MVRIHLPPAESHANHRFLNGGGGPRANRDLVAEVKYLTWTDDNPLGIRPGEVDAFLADIDLSTNSRFRYLTRARTRVSSASAEPSSPCGRKIMNNTSKVP